VRHFNVISIPEASKEILTKIFSSILNGFLRTGFVDAV
jgi:dynein heavy chain, axonemal